MIPPSTLACPKPSIAATQRNSVPRSTFVHGSCLQVLVPIVFEWMAAGRRCQDGSTPREEVYAIDRAVLYQSPVSTRIGMRRDGCLLLNRRSWPLRNVARANSRRKRGKGVLVLVVPRWLRRNRTSSGDRSGGLVCASSRVRVAGRRYKDVSTSREQGPIIALQRKLVGRPRSRGCACKFLCPMWLIWGAAGRYHDVSTSGEQGGMMKLCRNPVSRSTTHRDRYSP